MVNFVFFRVFNPWTTQGSREVGIKLFRSSFDAFVSLIAVGRNVFQWENVLIRREITL